MLYPIELRMHREDGIYEPPFRSASDYLTFQSADGEITSPTSLPAGCMTKTFTQWGLLGIWRKSCFCWNPSACLP